MATSDSVPVTFLVAHKRIFFFFFNNERERWKSWINLPHLMT